VGGRYAVLSLHGEGGEGTEGGVSLMERWDDEDCGRRLAEGDMRRLLAHENVPPYLELPLLSALHSIHREEVPFSLS
jgi:hypothetical protein